MLNVNVRSGLGTLLLGFFALHACGGTSRNNPRGNAGTAGSSQPVGATAGTAEPGTAGVGASVGTGGVGGGNGTSGVGGISYGCFEAGSRVATPRGSVAIEQLVVGDTVLAFDEQSGAVAARPITATFVHEVPASGRLALADGRVLSVTGEHPIFDAERGDYVRADAFDGGETLVTLTESLGAAGAFEPTRLGVALAAAVGHGFVKHAEGRRTTVYNISVAGLENYFVEGVLVHNKSGGPGACFGNPPMFAGDACTDQPRCLGPSRADADHVDLNEPVSSNVGGAPNDGAGGQAGAEPAEAGAGGAGSTVDPSLPLSAPTCDDFSIGERTLLALDYHMPSTPGVTPGFAFYQGNACAGVHIGEVHLDEGYSPPALGSITTQCVSLGFSNMPDSITVQSLHPEGRVTNLRVVASCECPRALREWTSCGLTAARMCQ